MKEKYGLPVALMVVLAVTRIPGMLPQNFSAVYALVFCAGVYFSGPMAWWLPLATVLATDVGLNLYYQFALGINSFGPQVLMYMAGNYSVYLVLIWLGRKFSPKSSLLGLLGGGILGALIFYVITNTISWFLNPFANPEYTKNLTGWIVALTKGTAGWPQTWEFFRNTLMSGGIFTGLFAGAMKLSESAEEQTEAEGEPAAEAETEPHPAEPEPG